MCDHCEETNGSQWPAPLGYKFTLRTESWVRRNSSFGHSKRFPSHGLCLLNQVVILKGIPNACWFYSLYVGRHIIGQKTWRILGLLTSWVQGRKRYKYNDLWVFASAELLMEALCLTRFSLSGKLKTKWEWTIMCNVKTCSHLGSELVKEQVSRSS
jgi:hypothetical protein